MSVNMGTAVAYLELDTSKFTKGFSSAYNELKVFIDKSATAEQKMLGLSSAMQSVGSSATKYVTTPLLGVGALATKVTTDFESGMSEVMAISGATAEEFEQLKDKAVEMGAKTKFSASESADAFKYMAMAGWDAHSMMAGIEGIMNLASASGEDLATTSDIVTDALTAFGLQAKDSAHFADVLAMASSKSNTNVGLMGETFKYVAPVAGALGFSIEDTAVAIGLMANSGIKGSQAGTALRSVFTRLAKPTKQVLVAMEKLNISMTNADGTMKPLNQLLLEMRDRFSGLIEAEKAQYASSIAGQEGMSGLLSIVNASEQDFQKLTKEINNASGSANEMASIMLDNTAGAVEQLGGALESAGIVVGNRLTPHIRRLAEWITELVEKFNSLSDEQIDQIVKWGGIVTAIGPVLLIGGKFLKFATTTIGTITKVNAGISLFAQALRLSKMGLTDTAKEVSGLYRGLTSLGSGFTLLSNPVGIAVTAITALTVAMVTADKVRDAQIKKLSELTGAEKELAETIEKEHETYTKMMEARQTNIDNINAEAEQTKNLWAELQTIVDENGKIKQSYEDRANVIVGQLSDAIGLEIAIVDGQIQGYSDLNATIDETIQKQKALAIQEALKEDYALAIKNRATAQKEYNDALSLTNEKAQKVAEKQAELNEVDKKYNDGIFLNKVQLAEYSIEHAKLSEELTIAEGKLSKAEKALGKAEDALVGYNQTIQNYEGLNSALVNESAEEIDMALLKVEQGFLTSETSTRKSLKEQNKTLQEQYKKMKQNLKDGTGGVTQEMVDQMGQLVEQSKEELNKKLEEQKQTLINRFGELGVELPEEMRTKLEEAKPKTQEALIALLDNLKEGTTLKAGELKTLFSNMGIEVPDELVKQLKEQSPSVQRQAINLLTELQTAEEEKRPEIVQQMKDLGLEMDDNIVKGLEENKGKVEEKSKNVGYAGMIALQGVLSATKVQPPELDNINNAESVANDARSRIEQIFKNPIKAVISAVEEFVTGTNGSHANGLSYVPYNGYIAELHEGERVLTKQENEQYNRNKGNGNGQGGDTYNFYNVKPDPYEYAKQMKRAKQQLLYDV